MVDRLARIRRAADAIDQADAKLRTAVVQAKAAGHSWADIGEALGVTRQAAQIRFGGDVKASLTPGEASRHP